MTAPRVVKTIPEIPIPGFSAVLGLDQAVGRVHAWTANRHNWTRVGWFVVGYALMIGGVLVIARKPVGRAVARTAELVK